MEIINIFNHLHFSDMENFINYVKNKSFEFYCLIDLNKLFKLFKKNGISYYKCFIKSLNIKYSNDLKRFNYYILSFLSENDYI